jgi:predicted nucleotidyltransferase
VVFVLDKRLRRLETGQIVLAAADEVMSRIAAMAREYFGEDLDLVILHGSAVHPENFREGGSDLDVAIVLNNEERQEKRPSWEFRDLVVERFPNGPWSRIETVIRPRAAIERVGRNFELCYEGQVARGVRYYDAGKEFVGEVLSRDAARSEVALKYIEQAWRWVSTTQPDVSDTAWFACRSACRAMHALLVNYEIDVSPKALRWNLTALYEGAASIHPELEGVRQFIEWLHDGLAQYADPPYEDSDDDDPEATISNRRRLIAASMKIVRRAERVLGVKVSNGQFAKFMRQFEGRPRRRVRCRG